MLRNRKQKNKTFTLTGDVRHPGRVRVRAASLAEAVEKAQQGDFTVYDEQNTCLAFDYNCDKDSVEVVD